MANDRELSGWAGWAMFAGVMMITLGAFQAIAGLTALFNDSWYAVTKSGLLINVDYTQWGWVHLALGLLIAFAGGAVLNGRTWGRVIGITLACISAIVNLAFMPAYPVWSILIIAVDVLVIYALAVHGAELKPRNQNA